MCNLCLYLSWFSTAANLFVRREANRGIKHDWFPIKRPFSFYFFISLAISEGLLLVPYYVTQLVKFSCGMKPDYPEKPHNFQQSVDLYPFRDSRGAR